MTHLKWTRKSEMNQKLSNLCIPPSAFRPQLDLGEDFTFFTKKTCSTCDKEHHQHLLWLNLPDFWANCQWSRSLYKKKTSHTQNLYIYISTQYVFFPREVAVWKFTVHTNFNPLTALTSSHFIILILLQERSWATAADVKLNQSA